MPGQTSDLGLRGVPGPPFFLGWVPFARGFGAWHGGVGSGVGFGRKLVRWGAGLSALGLAAELGASFFLPPPPVDKTPLLKAAGHPTYGYLLVPNQTAYSYQAEILVGPDGFRADPPPLPGTTLAWVLGGSEAFGKGMRAEETFAKLWQQKDPRLAVKNAGVPDWNLAQAIRYLEYEGEKGRPQRVVLTFYWNDLLPDHSLTAHTATAAQRHWAPRVWAQKTGALEYIAPLYTRSRLLYLARNHAKIWVGRQRGHLDQTIKDALLSGETPPELEDFWRKAEADLSHFQALCQKIGAAPTLLILPIEEEILEHHPRAHFRARAVGLGQKLGLPTLDVGPKFAAAADKSRLFIPYDGRPSAQGHQVIAEALSMQQ